MLRVLFIFFALPILVFAEGLCSDGEDLMLFHHVNVQTGELSLSLTDAAVSGAEPLLLERFYHEGEWEMLSYINLFIDPASLTARIANDSYIFSHHENKDVTVFRLAGSKLSINWAQHQATLTLPDGRERIYEGGILPPEGGYFHLTKEIRLNKRSIIYTYEDQYLIRIESSNLDHTKIYAWIAIEPGQIITSDDQRTAYRFSNHSISSIISNRQPLQEMQYTEDGDLNSLKIADSELRVRYLSNGQVEAIEAPQGTGQPLVLARFRYLPKETEVRDSENRLIRYFFNDHRLEKIEYFDELDHLAASTAFYWKNDQLVSKVFLDDKGQALFAKTFVYDDLGRVVEDALWGDLTGTSPALAIDSAGQPSHTESYRKTTTYLGATFLPTMIREDDGPTTQYFYDPTTHLAVSKLTRDEKRIIIREYYSYNEDGFLIESIVDDGINPRKTDLTGVTSRQITRIDRDCNTQLPHIQAELCFDPKDGKEHLIKKIEQIYSRQNRVIEEKFFDSEGIYRYSIHTQTDENGRIISRTNPLGLINRYRYDSLGRLLEEKEIGSVKKTYLYDFLGRRIASNGAQSMRITYDSKGRPLSQIDSNGRSIEQSYDVFGRCIEARCSNNTEDVCIQFQYDSLGNLALTRAPEGEIVRTTYNIWKKPIRVIRPDGTEIAHLYNRSGTLAKTTQPDGTEIRYTYDSFQRMLSETTVSSHGVFLAKRAGPMIRAIFTRSPMSGV